MEGFTTKAIHGRQLVKDSHGSIRMPVYDSVAFEFEDAESIEQAFRGQKFAHSYSRISNPTVADFEQKVTMLADGLGAIAVSSGMAAISSSIIALCKSGDSILTSKFLFGNTVSLFEYTLKPWGLMTNYVDFTDISAVERATDSSTKIIFLEVITNPQLKVADIDKITAIAKKHNIIVILDNTCTTSYLFRSKDHGVDVEIISSTKYMSGGATSVGGIIIDNGNFDWSTNAKLERLSKKFGPYVFLMNLRTEVYRNLGPCMSPHNAFLQSIGLETLAMRIERSSDNALSLAHFLKGHPKVQAVNYPGLPDSPDNVIATKQFGKYFAGILTFDLKDKSTCYQFMNKLKLIKRATNINDNKTLIIHPSSTILCEYSDEQKKDMMVSDSLLRLSVGIEDVDDLKTDIEKALEGV